MKVAFLIQISIHKNKQYISRIKIICIFFQKKIGTATKNTVPIKNKPQKRFLLFNYSGINYP